MVNKNKVGIIIQARMGSSRLPGKIAMKLPYNGELSVIEHIIARAKAANPEYMVAVATSMNPENDWLAGIAHKQEVQLFRGDENDVLSRYAMVAQQHKLDTIVRLTGDNPCIDSTFINQAVEEHITKRADYTYTQGLPLGMNVEVVSNTALQRAHQQGHTPNNREHVTHFIHQNPDKFTLYYPKVLPRNISCADTRLTVDTPQDYALMCILYEQLYTQNNLFGLADINTFLDANPWATAINHQVIQKQAYQSFEEERQAAIELLDKNGFKHTITLINEKYPT